MQRRFVITFFVASLTLAACKTAAPFSANDLDQKWNADQIERWYEASQGSRLLPLSWAKELEIPGGTEKFLGDAHVKRLNYLPHTTKYGDRLPVGFAVDRTQDDRLSWTNTKNMRWKQSEADREPWLGLNCSACHTAEITYGTHAPLRVEGGPAMSDFQTLLADLRSALQETSEDPAKFDRFAKGVLRTEDGEKNRDLLRAALTQLLNHELALGRLNQTDLKYGYGRLDAFGHIYNKTAFVSAGTNAQPSPSDAPVSYPFLWNVPQHDKVQWNGIAPNKRLPGLQPFDVGALGRNAGEVIGVFADIQPKSGHLVGYPSSINVDTLVAFEQQLGTLRPPAWPVSVFGFDQHHDALVKTGRALFSKNCASCHAIMDRTDLKTPIKAKILLFKSVDPPGTDIWMACNSYIKSASTGVLQNMPRFFFYGDPLEDEASLSDMLTVTVAGSLFEQKGSVIRAAAASFFGVKRPAQITAPAAGMTLKEQQAQRCQTETSNILGYKARPLNGIWATAPYLHNGSVPSLFDLLHPADQRPKVFKTGTREFDPQKVGYRYDDTPGNNFIFDTQLPGNSNAGHDYGAGRFTDDERWAIVEYLKTL